MSEYGEEVATKLGLTADSIVGLDLPMVRDMWECEVVRANLADQRGGVSGAQCDVLRASSDSDTGVDAGNDGEGERDALDHEGVARPAAEAEPSEAAEDGFVSCRCEGGV